MSLQPASECERGASNFACVICGGGGDRSRSKKFQDPKCVANTVNNIKLVFLRGVELMELMGSSLFTVAFCLD